MSRLMRFLIVRACAIGDFVLHLPALRALGLSLPRRNDSRSSAIPAPSHWLDTFCRSMRSIPSRHSHGRACSSGPALVRRIRFDAAWVWMKDPVLLPRISGGPAFPKFFTRIHFPRRAMPPTTFCARSTCQLLNFPIFGSASSERVILHPGSGSPSKVWPVSDSLRGLCRKP